MTRREPDPDELLERRVARMLDTEVDGAAWATAVEEGLRRSAKVRQRRRLRVLGWPAGGGPRLSMALGVTGVLAVVVLAGVIAVRGPWATRVGAPGVTGTPPPASAVERFVEARRRVPPFEPVAAIQHAGSLWVTTLGTQILRLDPVTGATTGREGLPGNACGPIEAAEGYLWMPSCATGPGQPSRPTFLTQVDPTTGQVVRNIEFAAGSGLGVGSIGGVAWTIADAATGQLAAIDPATGTVSFATPLGLEITHLAADGRFLWLAVPDESSVIRYDPASGAETGRIEVDGEPSTLLSTEEGLWVAVRGAKTVDRIDTERLQVDLTTSLADTVVQLASVDRSVWILTRADIFRLDAATGEITERIAVGEHAVAFAPQFTGPTYAMAAGDDVWFVPPRGEMLRLRVD